jgi:hypothetical protein
MDAVSGPDDPGAAAAGPAAATSPSPQPAPEPASEPAPEPASVPASTITPALPAEPHGAVRWWTAGTTVVLAGLWCLGAYAGTWTAAGAVLLAVLALAAGWPALLGLPTPRGTTAVVALGGALSAVAVGATDSEPRLVWLAPALAGGVVGEFAHQLARRDARPRMVESVSGTIAGLVVLASLATVLALPGTPAGADGVATWAAAVTVAVVVQALTLPGRWLLALGVVLGALVGALLGGLLHDDTVVAGLVVGAISAAVAVMLHRLLVVLPSAGRAPGWLALAVAPVAGSAIVAYVVLRLAVG